MRLGAQLCRADGALVDRDFARAWLPGPLAAGTSVEVPIELPAPDAAGAYQLRFDLVSEGIDWFEACGSPVTGPPARGGVGASSLSERGFGFPARGRLDQTHLFTLKILI